MTRRAMKDWNPERELAALLNALAAELVAAPDYEVRALLGETGARGRGAIKTMRRLLAAADADVAVSPIADAPVDGPGILPHRASFRLDRIARQFDPN